MILNLGSLAFNADIATPGGNPAWGTELGQGEGYKFVFEDMSDFFTGMVYKSIVDTDNVTCPLGKGGNQRADYDFVIASLFEKVYVNGKKVNDARFLLLVVKKLNGDHHVGRRTIKYNPRMTYRGEYINEDCYQKMALTMGLPNDAAWFVYEIYIVNQDELHFTAFELGDKPQTYRNNDERKKAFISRLPKNGERQYRLYQPNLPLQQIFYGAPGTGKSYEIKNKTKGDSIIRTTFHPDSDYSTFVGAYKPVMDDVDAKVVPVVLGESGTVFNKNEGTYKEKRIVYQFVMQAFLKAYLCAWKKYAEATGDEVKPQFLVIEEINRGNCAQIFGDLFQLLDRGGKGFSEYPIEADNDLQREIERAFKEHKEYMLSKNIDVEGVLEDYTSNYGATLSEDIQSGRVLLLPSNLYIWATMNTSDQSLFPIDSAFKRRWEWVYTPIAQGKDEHGNLMKWQIEGLGENSWWTFIQGINEVIDQATHSEDKKLGFFFCKAQDGVIKKETFVNKVVFYLWNDVFKVYGFKSEIFDKKGKGDKTEKITFKSFYKNDGSVNEETMSVFVKNVMAKAPKVETNNDAQNENEETGEESETEA